MAKVTSKGIRLRAIAERLEREAAELRRLADLEDNVARVMKSSAKAKPRKAVKKLKVTKRKKVVAKKRPAKGNRRAPKASTRATVKAAQRAVGRGGR